jgi:hypothetical protein
LPADERVALRAALPGPGGGGLHTSAPSWHIRAVHDFQRIARLPALTDHMERQEGAPAEGAGDALFSEQIRLWLDEGDRLDAESGSTPIAGAIADPGPLRRVLRRLGERAARHRMTVMAGFGLLPLVLFAAIHHGAAPPAVATVTVVAPRAPQPAPLPREREVIASASPAPSAAPAAAESPVSSGRPPGHAATPRHHHHHHQQHHRIAQRAAGHRR